MPKKSEHFAEKTDISHYSPKESWRNLDFLASPDARLLRIVAEYLEPAARFKKFDVHNVIVFWGSARQLPRLKKYYADAEKLAYLVTEWSKQLGEGKRQFFVATGGGEGIMGAANKGASKAGGKSVGMNITLPFEQKPNQYITRELSIQFHYFFMRKFWMVYLAKALIAFPGGFGTIDELSEVLTLVQTGKPKKIMPIILYGSEYWNKVINFKEMAEWGVISEKDLELFKIVDTPEEAFEYLTKRLTELYL
jgi:hypothetical protein